MYTEMYVFLPKMCSLSRQVVSHGSGFWRQLSLYMLIGRLNWICIKCKIRWGGEDHQELVTLLWWVHIGSMDRGVFLAGYTPVVFMLSYLYQGRWLECTSFKCPTMASLTPSGQWLPFTGHHLPGATVNFLVVFDHYMPVVWEKSKPSLAVKGTVTGTSDHFAVCSTLMA